MKAAIAGVLIGLAPAGGGFGPFGLGAAEAATKPSPKSAASRGTIPSAKRSPPARKAAEPVALGFISARYAVYKPAFSGALHPAAYGRFPSRINRLVSQEFPPTPEYSYLYTPNSVITAAPSATSYRYAADNRFLLSPVPGARSVAEAYSWNRSWINANTMRVAGQGYRALPHRGIGRDPGKKIDNTLDPRGLSPEPAPSEMNQALRNLRLPASLGASP